MEMKHRKSTRVKNKFTVRHGIAGWLKPSQNKYITIQNTKLRVDCREGLNLLTYIFTKMKHLFQIDFDMAGALPHKFEEVRWK